MAVAVRQGYRMELKEAQFDAVPVGGRVAIPVHEGALGMEWVDLDAVRGITF